MLTLWDLVKPLKIKAGWHGQVLLPVKRRVPVKERASRQGHAIPEPAARPRSPDARVTAPTMADRYEALTRAMLKQHNVRVRKWRTGMSGVAWQVRYADGTTARLIESPRPKGPMSAAIFLHEIGHHAIGFNVYRPRCLEEYHAWAWSLAQMQAHGLNITDAVRRRMHESLWYAVEKAKRRGLREVPPELQAFTTRPPRRRHGKTSAG